MRRINNTIWKIALIWSTILYSIQVMAQCDFVDQKSGRRYIGECKSNIVDGNVIRIPDGQGKLIYPDGSYFIGKFSNGQRVSGTYYWEDGQRIENAIYENDKLKNGIYYYPSGAKYEGSFKNDKFDGKGIYYYKANSDKSHYEGEFKDGMYNGKGTLTYKNGSTDKGLWKDDVFLGAKIGKYNDQNVTLNSEGIVYVSAIDKEFDLEQQIRVAKNSNYSEGSITDRLDITRYYLIHNENCIGWVDNLSHTVGFRKSKKITFTEKGNIIEGFNLFGSIYIGPNNPKDASGNPSYLLLPQDVIDEAALKHDKCYESRGAKGTTSALFNTDVYDCDIELITSCSFYIPEYSSIYSGTKNLMKSLIKWSYDPDITTRATLVAAAFANTSAGKYIFKANKDNKQSGNQKITYSTPTTLASTSGDQFKVDEGDTFDGEMKDGRIVSGKICDKNGNTKHLILPKRNH